MSSLVTGFALVTVLFVGFAGVNAGAPCGTDIGAYEACTCFLDDRFGEAVQPAFPLPAQATITRTGPNEWYVGAMFSTETATGFEIEHEWTCVATYDERDGWAGTASPVE